ncbi:macrolide-specific efflux protein, ATP-binding/permease protein MacB [Candidatus Campylobacter infans]|uniref:Pyoverdine export ATP-binding/permease protein PvdT n=1 Tax=Candidatus Campylobacter infans TaxID=2561898 RepID=A0A7H9CGE5_9BACT|nr:MacB family efflux pump subunit [Candidatus Campylobacter infans]QLI05203.1 macrolide-specific efflux protein, ATP-binding/permease protein MacB [Candidatus Campylobacter infans]
MIELKNICKVFQNGDERALVLKNINLEIKQGEFVAIIGQSGSGKSTLMNILGCLDTPSSGTYTLDGKDISHFSKDELSELRLKKFGFIFQRYNLIPASNATENVALPGIYAGTKKFERTQRAKELLSKLGLGDKTDFMPNHLSGGQQQRVSIARALMNGGEILLCDEPTGALDSASGQTVMQIIKELNQAGHTIIMVTHDKQIASWASRVIEISDGRIISDNKTEQNLNKLNKPKSEHASDLSRLKDRFFESFNMSISAIKAHKLRSFLTMLGIIIGISSVICVVALARGSQENILEGINKMGVSTITIFPGRGFGDRGSAKRKNFSIEDINILESLEFVDNAMPRTRSSGTLIYANTSSGASVHAGTEMILKISSVELKSGRNFTKDDIQNSASVIIIDENTQKTFFKDSDPLGKIMIFNKRPFMVIGVGKRDEGAFSDGSLSIYMPYTTLANKVTGSHKIRSIVVGIAPGVNSQLAEHAISEILKIRRGGTDFYMINSDTILKTIKATTDTMSLLISGIALISLVVGGIGVMNIMLVSVIERTKEIGVRMAIGAKGADIMLQFLIEAILLCALGGIIGVLLAFGIGGLFNLISNDIKMSFSLVSIIIAFGISSLVGIVFGYMPAKRAAKLNPIDALLRE